MRHVSQPASRRSRTKNVTLCDLAIADSSSKSWTQADWDRYSKVIFPPAGVLARRRSFRSDSRKQIEGAEPDLFGCSAIQEARCREEWWCGGRKISVMEVSSDRVPLVAKALTAVLAVFTACEGIYYVSYRVHLAPAAWDYFFAATELDGQFAIMRATANPDDLRPIEAVFKQFWEENMRPRWFAKSWQGLKTRQS